MDRSEFDLWRLKVRLVSDQLDRIENGVKAILGELNCPTEIVLLHAIVAGEQKAPWPEQNAERSKRQAKNALHALLTDSRFDRIWARGEQMLLVRLIVL